MCHLCNTKPVYEFTNKRKLCKTCYIRWFEKKVLYTIRKFGMLKKGEVVGYKRGNDFRNVVLEEVLKMIGEKGFVEITTGKKFDKFAIPLTIDLQAYEIVNEVVNGNVAGLKKDSERIQNFLPHCDPEPNSRLRSANNNPLLPTTKSLAPTRKKLNHASLNFARLKLIAPLRLFLDKEVELYARLKKLRYKKFGTVAQMNMLGSKTSLKNLASKNNYRDNKSSTENRAGRRFEATNNRATLERGKLDFNKIIDFIDGLEQKHPEIKRAIVNGLVN